jgi:hypothetical protein
MRSQRTEELRDFHRFVGEQLSNGGGELSPEEALDEWRRLHPDAAGFEEDIAALREALNDAAKGDQGMLFDDFDRDFRQRHHLPDTP